PALADYGGDLLSDAAFEHRAPGHQRELAALLDDTVLVIHHHDAARHPALDVVAGAGRCVREAQLRRQLHGDAAKLALPQRRESARLHREHLALGMPEPLAFEPEHPLPQRRADLEAEPAS